MIKVENDIANIIESASYMMEWKIEQDLVGYIEAVSFMEERAGKIAADTSDEMVWMLEHPPLYTAGVSAKNIDLLEPKFPVYETSRGGQYTYHGPGQRVAYIMLNLKKRYYPKVPDIRDFVYNLESWIINTLAAFDITGERREDRIGIWVALPDKTEAKIAALGLKVSKGVSYHGISLNVNPDLSHFNGIVPCGIKGHQITSMKALGINTQMNEIDTILVREFKKIF